MAKIATVRIMRVLKGRYPNTRVKIGSGPILCRTVSAIMECDFHVGDQSLFILPAYPKDGAVAMTAIEDALPLSAISMIERELTAAAACRSEYLIDLQMERPKVFAAAWRLADEMRKAAETWPEEGEDKVVPKGWYKTGLRDLEKKLAEIDVEVIRAALAIDWLADEPHRWSSQPVWKEAFAGACRSRQQEIDADQERWIEKTLAHAGVESRYIEEYVDALRKTASHGELCFPYKPSSNARVLDPDGKTNADDLSTDFVLRANCYDREGYLAIFRSNFHTAKDWLLLSRLKPARIKLTVALLMPENDRGGSLFVRGLIPRLPGTEFVDLVASAINGEGCETSWKLLENPTDDKETAARLSLLMEKASAGGDYGTARLFRSLRCGNCFYPICIERGIDVLAKAEKLAQRKGAKKKTETSDHGFVTMDAKEAEMHFRQMVIDETRDYLAAARVGLENAKPPVRSAAEYRRWFKEYMASLPKSL